MGIPWMDGLEHMRYHAYAATSYCICTEKSIIFPQGGSLYPQVGSSI